MEVWVAYYYDENNWQDFVLIGVRRTADEAQKLADRWAQENNVKLNYATWALDEYGWTRYEVFVRPFQIPA